MLSKCELVAGEIPLTLAFAGVPLLPGVPRPKRPGSARGESVIEVPSKDDCGTRPLTTAGERALPPDPADGESSTGAAGRLYGERSPRAALQEELFTWMAQETVALVGTGNGGTGHRKSTANCPRSARDGGAESAIAVAAPHAQGLP